MTTPNPTAADIAAVRQRLNQFSCLSTPPDLAAAEMEQMRTDIRDFNDWSEYQTLGICASTLEEGQRALVSFLGALGVSVKLDLPPRSGPVYLKFNTLKRAWYLDDYSGSSRGVLITFHSSDPETEAVAGTYGPFPFDLFIETA